jgi:hypothetical protein
MNDREVYEMECGGDRRYAHTDVIPQLGSVSYLCTFPLN